MADRATDLLRWYVVHTHPRQEDRAEKNFRLWNLETFFPRIVDRRYNRFTGDVARIVKPLFPRYIFLRLNIEKLYHKVRFTRGVHSVVSFNNRPCFLDDQIIALIKSGIGRDGFVRIGEEFKVGDEVVIKDGLLKDFTGIFERRMNGSDRVMILLKTINYQVHVAIERALIKRPDSPLN